MMLIPELALRNLLSAGLRTWLNVVALSFSFVAIIFVQGFYDGLNDQVERSTIDAIYAGGQYWHRSYDPFDPLSLDDAHGPVPSELRGLVADGKAAPILVRRGSIYPQGRFRSVLVKGIDPGQRFLAIPSSLLRDTAGVIPCIIGSRMARSSGLRTGDVVTVQWRDAHGTFDAREVSVAGVFRTNVQDIDNDQLWLPLDPMRRLMGMGTEATVVVLAAGTAPPPEVPGWTWRDLSFLLRDLHTLVRLKSVGASILYLLLLFLAMLAIFDTQVLSIWRRRKEMGTMMALGMTRGTVIGLFTLEGALHGLLAALVAAAYGIPLFALVANRGVALPSATDSMGFAIGERLFPVYSPFLVVGTTVLVCLVTTVVSFLPTRRIARLKPTDALRGRMS